MEKYSFSRVNSILECPKKYHNSEFESNIFLQLGLKFHNALELYINTGIVDDYIMDSYDSEFIPKILKALELTGKERLLSELHLETDEVKGFIDLLIIDDEQKTICIADLKTISDARKKEYSIDKAEQLTLYAKLFRLLYPQFDEYKIHLGYILYLKKTKVVKFNHEYLSEKQMNSVYKNFMVKGSVAKNIVDNGLWFARENSSCFFCKMKDKCKGVTYYD